jgi:hypothetical protein
MGKGEVYPKEADILYLIDIKRIINYSLFLLTGAIWDVPEVPYKGQHYYDLINYVEKHYVKMYNSFDSRFKAFC